eukprot:CAMPEP_0179231714 /NCGR_PEP_ID=MMETSP0797-20121207/11484_1 /TAXON_ID=47934 /ORGANISM="Dinophysis acuminata, Strain DAEP01" /LENGTH=470 /DNA_ID=CAMNT_0020938807 /DNA_START=184 /DNA_END=1596 /DNA_ORIENTATION=-
MRTLLAAADSCGVDAPGLYLVPHTVAPEDHGNVMADEMVSMNFGDTVMHLGFDGVIAEEPEGLDLVLAVRMHTHRTQITLAAIKAAIKTLHIEKRSIRYYQEVMDITRWSYLRERLQCRIPPVDPSLAGGELRSVPGYTFGRWLGSGHTGSIYMLEPLTGGSSGATAGPSQVIKTIDKAKITQIEELMRLKQLVDTMLLLNEERWRHENLVLLNEIYHTKTHILLRMDCGGPENLSSWLGSRHRDGAKPLELREVASLIRQIVTVVAHMHQGPHICHRDIKPDNMTIDYTPRITLKLVDYDFARVQNDGELCRNFCGTIPYIAPEVALQDEYDGMAADIWSEAIVLFEVLCGCRAMGQILHVTNPRGRVNNRQGSGDKPWRREKVTALVARFSQLEFLGRMAGTYCHSELSALLPVMRPLLSSMSTVPPDRRLKAQQTLDAVQTLRDSSSGTPASDGADSGSGGSTPVSD